MTHKVDLQGCDPIKSNQAPYDTLIMNAPEYIEMSDQVDEMVGTLKFSKFLYR